jgi:hypothetical protein
MSQFAAENITNEALGALRAKALPSMLQYWRSVSSLAPKNDTEITNRFADSG